jgi:hypothetical protein
MGLPKAAEAQPYYRAALQRLDDAELLLTGERTTGAVYLAGYTVECMLKALLLDGVARKLRQQLSAAFRGSRAHDIAWLSGLYRQHVTTAIPRAVVQHLSRVASWSSDLRYATAFTRRSEADLFMESVDAVAVWADGRM